jgi:hypothetical protein
MPQNKARPPSPAPTLAELIALYSPNQDAQADCLRLIFDHLDAQDGLQRLDVGVYSFPQFDGFKRGGGLAKTRIKIAVWQESTPPRQAKPEWPPAPTLTVVFRTRKH